MLVSHRKIEIPSLDVSIARHEALSELLRVKYVRMQGVTLEERIHAQGGLSEANPKWDAMVISLDASWAVHSGNARTSLAPGDGALAPASTMQRRAEGLAEGMLVQWDPERVGESGLRGLATGRLGERLRAAVRRVAEALRTSALPEVVAAGVAELFSALRGEGVPVREVDPSELSERSAVREGVARALDDALARVGDRPMGVDVEKALSLSRAQCARHIADFLRSYRLGADNFREYRNRIRVELAVTLMTAIKATTEGVAALLGYSSPTALCRAFANAGLPSPANIRHHIEAFGSP